jgi:hypothetical protein
VIKEEEEEEKAKGIAAYKRRISTSSFELPCSIFDIRFFASACCLYRVVVSERLCQTKRYVRGANNDYS